MFIDEQTEAALKNSSVLGNSKRVGLWRIIVVHSIPYNDSRRNGKVRYLFLLISFFLRNQHCVGALIEVLVFDESSCAVQIPKLLLHRIFPNVRYSIWIDGKLQLSVDPYKILERYTPSSAFFSMLCYVEPLLL